MRVPLPSPGTGGQGGAVEFSRTKRANRGPFLFAGGVCLPRSGRPCGRTRLIRPGGWKRPSCQRRFPVTTARSYGSAGSEDQRAGVPEGAEYGGYQ